MDSRSKVYHRGFCREIEAHFPGSRPWPVFLVRAGRLSFLRMPDPLEPGDRNELQPVLGLDLVEQEVQTQRVA